MNIVKSLQKKMIALRLRGTSCFEISQELNLSRSSVALWLNKNGYTAKEVLHHHGISTEGCKASQISGMMTALLKKNKPVKHVVPIALQEYLLNPNSCEHCSGHILPNNKQPLEEIKKKKFCSPSCSNKNRAKPYAIVTKSSTCKNCGNTFSWKTPRNVRTQKVFCSTTCKSVAQQRSVATKLSHHPKMKILPASTKTAVPRLPQNSIENLTKDELFALRSSWQSARSGIQDHAVRVFEKSSKPKSCLVCGYSKHVEVCHVKPVASFPGSAKLKEINSLSNVIGLCPNHHGEFDDGFLSLDHLLGEP